jgi:hypothetical protein
MPNPPESDLLYRIDASGTIIEVNSRWTEFLRENLPPHAPAPDYVGARLWDCLGNRTLIHFYQAMVAKVRRTGGELIVPLRCDSPAKRRYLELHIRRRPAGVVEFRSVTLREESAAAPGPPPLLAVCSRYSDELVRMCSWCRRVAAPDWVEVEEAVRRLRLFESQEIPKVTHTICESCGALMQEKLREI